MKRTIQIDDKLQKLGITKKYNGYYLLKHAVELTLEDDLRLQSVIKEIYTPVAEKYKCNPCCVERNIRTVLYKAWKSNRKELNKIARYELTKEPSVSEMISILVADIQRTEALFILP